MFITTAIVGVFAISYTMIQLDRDKMLRCLSMTGVTMQVRFLFGRFEYQCKCESLQGICKLALFLKTDRLSAIIEYLKLIYRQCERNKRCSKIVVQWASLFQQLCKLFIALIILSTSSFFCYSVGLYVFTGILEPFLPVYLPGLSDDSKQTYIILFVFHILLTFVTAFGSFATDFSAYFLALHICPIACILDAKLTELNGCLRNPLKGQTDIHVRNYIHNFIRLHSQFNV